MATQQQIQDVVELESGNLLNSELGRDYGGKRARANAAKYAAIQAAYTPAQIAQIKSTPEYSAYVADLAARSGPTGLFSGFLDSAKTFAGEAGVKEGLMLAAAAMGANALGAFGAPAGVSASGTGMTAAELAAGAPGVASIGGASGITPAMEAAGMLSAAGAPGVAASTAAANAATGLGYDMLGTAATGGGMLSGVSPAISQAAQTLAQAGITPEQVAANQNNPSWLQSVSNATGLSTSALGSIASTGLNALGGFLQGQSATSAAQTAANAQIEAARIAAEASKFKPVGVTTRFGGSQFGYDAQGNLISAGYQLSPEAKAQQDALMAMSNQALTQYQGAPAATAPMGTAAQTMFNLGQGYLQTTPQAQAAQYMSEQQALLAPGREREMAALQNRLQAQGRLGLATGGTSTGMLASQPELEALYNAQRMQDLQLAAQATQGGQQYAQFGAGMVGSGGDMLKGMYGTQQAAYAPYQTALGGAVGMEQLGQQPMDIGTSIGAKTSTAGAQAGIFRAQGLQGAAQTMQPANAYNPWATMLSNAGNAITNYQTQQQQQQQQQFQNNLMNQLITGRV